MQCLMACRGNGHDKRATEGPKGADADLQGALETGSMNPDLTIVSIQILNNDHTVPFLFFFPDVSTDGA